MQLRFQDDSREIARLYKGGLKKYNTLPVDGADDQNGYELKEYGSETEFAHVKDPQMREYLTWRDSLDERDRH
jgi:hypothetical protein